MGQSGAFLGIDLGGTDIKAVVLDRTGNLLWHAHGPTDAAAGREAVLDRLASVVGEAISGTPAAIEAAGFAIPGVLDPRTGTVELLTNFTPDWTGFALRDAIQGRSSMPSFLINDVRAATVAEHVHGAARAYRDFLCIAIGTGIGGGAVLNGELYLGSRGAAGEIGHQTIEPEGPRCNCGNHGCLEAVASGLAIARAGREAIASGNTTLVELTGSTTPTPEALACAARAGSQTAHEIFTGAGTAIGRALGNLVCVLNPEAIVVGGGIATAGDLLLAPIREEIARRTVVFTRQRGGVDVIQSTLGSQAGAIGAATWSMRRFDASAA